MVADLPFARAPYFRFDTPSPFDRIILSAGREMSQDILSRFLSTELSAPHSGAKLDRTRLQAPPTKYNTLFIDIGIRVALTFPFAIHNFLAILRFHGRGVSPIGPSEIASLFRWRK
jgi:hypothetical protein